MAQLIQLRQRIKAIETIQKVTHAMQLISMSSHLRLRDKKKKLQDYQSEISRIFTTVKSMVPSWHNKAFFPEQKTENILAILVGSQKGLCGIFNTNALYEFEKDIHEQGYKTGSVITIGKKIHEYLKTSPIKQPLKQIASYDELSWATLPKIIPSLLEKILETKHPYSKVVMYSNLPVGFFTQKPAANVVLPLSLDTLKDEASTQSDFVWEDSPKQILDALAHHQLNATIYNLLVQSILAEQAARFISMDNATRNAKKLKESMKLEYNKLRQAKITKELTELSSGFQN